ncbi:hypothetical protein [Laspinema olomoucense]|uniref:hypothetical protein n=1 Tax=Laspinema olomoucense TaxID=3231600 RepID=UPI0021BAC9B2|nr:hypothetical protein [Laspinema sp. D3d]MCT7971189.1 hypothetical protein [Laspinema sp. D3d]
MTYSITALCGNGITAAKKARKKRLDCKKEEFSPYVKGVFSLSVDWEDKYHHLLRGLLVFPEDCGQFNYCRKFTHYLDNEYYLYFCGEVDSEVVWEYTEHEEEKTLNLLDSWASNEETDKVIRCIKHCRDFNHQMIIKVYSSLNPLKPIPLI